MADDEALLKWNVTQPARTAKQNEVLKKVREEFKDELTTADDDAMLDRFCRARAYVFNDVKVMLQDYLKWRKESSVENLSLTPDIEHFLRYETFYILPKPDKWGRTVMILQPRYHNPNNRDYKVAMDAFYWGLNQSLQRLEPPLENYIAITDLAGYGLRNNDWSLMREQSDYLQNYYPERLGVNFVVNAPWYVNSVWKIISRWIDERTRKKIHFLGKNYKEALLELIEEEDLPEAYGGKYHRPPPEINMWTKEENTKSESESESPQPATEGEVEETLKDDLKKIK